jgi:hypothetical protein
MPTTELNEQSTTEDVQAHVDEVLKEVEQERADEQKSDAQIASEHAGKPAPEPKETSAETDSGSEPPPEGEDKADTAEVEDQGDETGDESGDQEWLTDDVKAEAAAYGIEESEIADFASREELDRALKLFDKSALEAGRKAMAESEGDDAKGPARNEKTGRFEKKEETPKADDQPAQAEKTVEGQYEIKLDKDVYDEELVGTLTDMRDHYETQRQQYETRLEAMEQRLQASEERFAEADALAEEQRFDAAIDKLNMPKLFGATGKETPDELKKREDVLAQAKVLQAGFRLMGRDVEVETLVDRVAPMVFPSEFDKHKLKQRTRKVSKQSNNRQGGGTTRPEDPREDPRDEADRLYRELERAH